jgi:hypothetical protein
MVFVSVEVAFSHWTVFGVTFPIDTQTNAFQAKDVNEWTELSAIITLFLAELLEERF